MINNFLSFLNLTIEFFTMSYPYQITSYDEYKAAWEKSKEDPEGFWSEMAEGFHWRKKWDKVLDWNFREPSKWFKGGKLNITENCIDRHLEKMGENPPLSGNPITRKKARIVTYKRLH